MKACYSFILDGSTRTNSRRVQTGIHEWSALTACSMSHSSHFSPMSQLHSRRQFLNDVRSSPWNTRTHITVRVTWFLTWPCFPGHPMLEQFRPVISWFLFSFVVFFSVREQPSLLFFSVISLYGWEGEAVDESARHNRASRPHELRLRSRPRGDLHRASSPKWYPLTQSGSSAEH